MCHGYLLIVAIYVSIQHHHKHYLIFTHNQLSPPIATVPLDTFIFSISSSARMQNKSQSTYIYSANNYSITYMRFFSLRECKKDIYYLATNLEIANIINPTPYQT